MERVAGRIEDTPVDLRQVVERQREIIVSALDRQAFRELPLDLAPPMFHIGLVCERLWKTNASQSILPPRNDDLCRNGPEIRQRLRVLSLHQADFSKRSLGWRRLVIELESPERIRDLLSLFVRVRFIVVRLEQRSLVELQRQAPHRTLACVSGV